MQLIPTYAGQILNSRYVCIISRSGQKVDYTLLQNQKSPRSPQRVPLGYFQGFIKRIVGSCVGRWALLQLQCSQARQKSQKELLGRNKQNLQKQPSDTLCTSLSSAPNGFIYSPLAASQSLSPPPPIPRPLSFAAAEPGNFYFFRHCRLWIMISFSE